MKRILMSCINDEKMVFPDAYFHPNTNAKNTIENDNEGERETV